MAIESQHHDEPVTLISVSEIFAFRCDSELVITALN